MLRRVLLIHTGGTLGMVAGAPDQGLKPAQLHQSVLHFVPELNEIARLDSVFASNIDSANLGIDNINAVVSLIEKHHDRYDGFVIIHGTDTMAFHASALSFLIENNSKPIIFTGSQKPLRHIRTDARLNLVNAVEFATRDIPEIGICFDAKLFRGNRTRKVSIGRFNAFQSPNYPLLGTVGVDLELNHAFVAQHPVEPVRFHQLQQSRIANWKLFPGFDADTYVDALIKADTRALIVEAYAAGNMPTQNRSLVPAVHRLTRAGIPVLVVSQALEGSVNLSLYDCGRQVMEAGAIGCGPMTFESTLFKLMFLYSRFDGITRDELAIKMQLDLAGELS